MAVISVSRTLLMEWNCTLDEGRPLEAVLQEMASNHLKRLPLRVVVVSVKEKALL